MNLIARARRYLSTSRRTARRVDDDDPADMGTAFGLDAITTLEPETPSESQLRADSPQPSRFELRLHRRSTL